MILQPIHNQRVLPAQVQQKVLPAVTVDTTEIHKLIDRMYNKTIVMPATHTYEVTHYVQTPQGLVKQPEPNNITSSIVSTQPEVVLPQQQIVVPASQVLVPQTQVVVPQTQVVVPQTQLLAPQAQLVVPQVQAVVPQPQVIVPQASVVVPQIQPTSSLVINQRNSLIQPVVPLTQSVLVSPAPQYSILSQPLSSYNPSMVLRAI